MLLGAGCSKRAHGNGQEAGARRRREGPRGPKLRMDYEAEGKHEAHGPNENRKLEGETVMFRSRTRRPRKSAKGGQAAKGQLRERMRSSTGLDQARRMLRRRARRGPAQEGGLGYPRREIRFGGPGSPQGMVSGGLQKAH